MASNPRSVRSINIRLILWTLITIIVLAPSLYFAHRYQVRVLANSLIDRADSLEKEGETLAATVYLQRFLRLNPEDNQIRVRMAKLVTAGASTVRAKERAIRMLYQAIGVAPEADKTELRLSVASLLLQLGRYVESEKESRECLTSSPSSAKAKGLLARSLYGQFVLRALSKRAQKQEPLGEVFAVAVLANPSDVLLSRLYADLIRQYPQVLSENQLSRWPTKESRLAAAKRVMQDLITAAPDSSNGYLARAEFRMKFLAINSPPVLDDLKMAIQYGAKEPRILLAVAMHAKRVANGLLKVSHETDSFLKPQLILPNTQSQFVATNTDEISEERRSLANEYYERSRKYYEDCLKQQPNNVPAQIGYGDILWSLDKRDEAEAQWTKAVAGPAIGWSHVDLFLRLANAGVEKRNLVSAGQFLNSAKSALPDAQRRDRAQRRLRERAVTRATHLIDLLQAKIDYYRGDYVACLTPLRRILIQDNTSNNPSIQFIASVLNAAANQNLARPEQAAIGYEKAAALNPGAGRLNALAGDMWMNSFRPQLALRNYQKAASQNDSADLLVSIARAQLHLEARVATNSQNLQRIQQTILRAVERSRNSSLSAPWRLDILRADHAILIARQARQPNPKRVGLEILRRAEKTYSKATVFMEKLPFVYQKLDATADADRVLRHLKTLSVSQERMLVIEADLLRRRRKFAEAKAVIAKHIDKVAETTRVTLGRIQVQIAIDQEEYATAADTLARLQDSDLTKQEQLAEVAIAMNDLESLSRCVAQLKAVEGPTGCSWRFFLAFQHVLEAKDAKDPVLMQAAELAVQVASQRPAWARIQLLRGRIADKRNDTRTAIDAYKGAIAMGENRLFAYERLIMLLGSERRFAEADEVLKKLTNVHITSPRIDSLEIEVAARKGDWKRAVTIARRAIDRNRQDASGHVWLGHTLSLSGESQEAEKSFLKATTLSPTDIRTWNGLFGFYLRTGKLAKARSVLGTLIKKTELTGAKKEFVLAQGLELLFDPVSAERHYQRAANLAPQNGVILGRVASFYLRRNPERAIEFLERIVKIAPNSNNARRALATVLAARGKPEDFQRAIKLLSQSRTTQGASEFDQRLRAILLSRRGGKDHIQNIIRAREVMEDLVARRANPTPGDRILLARLYLIECQIATLPEEEVQKKLHAARQQYISLCAVSAPKPHHVLAFVDLLVRQQKHQEAQRWIDRYVDLLANHNPPDIKKLIRLSSALVARQFPTRTSMVLGKLSTALEKQKTPEARHVTALVNLQLSYDPAAAHKLIKWDRVLSKYPLDGGAFAARGRLHKALGSSDKFIQIVETSAKQLVARAESNGIRAATIFQIIKIYAANGEYQIAEKWARQLVKLIPHRYDTLMDILVALDRVSEAVELCREMRKRDKSSRPFVALLSALTTHHCHGKKLDPARALINAGNRQFKNDAGMQLAQAHLMVLDGRIEEAERLYKEVLKKRPQNIVAINNLATMLAEKPDASKEALSYIHRAIQLAGPQPALLDTKGMILIQGGQVDEAVEHLIEASASPNPDPRYHFHLAVAYHRLGDHKRARVAFQRATSGKLSETILTPVDRVHLRILQRDYTND